MGIIFPSDPSFGQQFRIWTWDGEKWVCDCNFRGGDMPVKMIWFTSNGTYSPTPGIESAVVECVGGGGGGGGANTGVTTLSGGGGGGGSGGYSRTLLSIAQLGDTAIPVTVGGGGSAGAAGQPTTFGTLVTANGGSPGGDFTSAGGGAPGAGALPGIGQVALPGDPGMGFVIDQTGTGSVAYFGGRGGSVMGGAGGSVSGTAIPGGLHGASGSPNSGGGGSGAIVYQNATVFSGGSGASGWALVTEYLR